MSRIVARGAGATSAPLVWWELLLPANTDGHVAITHADNFDNPTWVALEIFDGDDGEYDLMNFAQVAQARTPAGFKLYALSRRRPTNSPDWRVVGDPVQIPAPWEREERIYYGYP